VIAADAFRAQRADESEEVPTHLAPWSATEQTTKEAAMSSGTADKAKGRVKEAAGALTDDKKLKAEGKTDQLAGKVKDAVETVVDKAKNALKR
jgi:uncharacterized protein YjbJ (UPF0337 family)